METSIQADQSIECLFALACGEGHVFTSEFSFVLEWYWRSNGYVESSTVTVTKTH